MGSGRGGDPSGEKANARGTPVGSRVRAGGLGALCGPCLRPSPAAPPLRLHGRQPPAPGGGGIGLIFKLISMDTYARAARASIMRHLCSFIAKQKCLLIIGGRVGAGSGRRGTGAAARGRAAAGNRREGRGDGARVAWGGPRSGRGGPFVQAASPGAPRTASLGRRARRAARSRGPQDAED